MTHEQTLPPQSAPWRYSLDGAADNKNARDQLLFHLAAPIAFGCILGANQAGIAFYLPWVASVAYWVVLCLITWQVLHWVTTALAFAGRMLEPPVILTVALGAILASFAMRPFMYIYSGWYSDLLLNGRTVQPMKPFAWTTDFLLQHLQLWAGMVTVWVVINFIFDRFIGLPRYRARLIAPTPPSEPSAPERSLAAPTKADTEVAARFGLAPGAEIWALKSEDHYVRVFSNFGEKLILMRFSDAIRDLADVPGARVHRSYWIAKKAVTEIDAQGRTLNLRLVNGLHVPVSQTYKEVARLAGIVT